MIKTQLEVLGMACEMCEAHMVETIRDAFPPDFVSLKTAMACATG